MSEITTTTTTTNRRRGARVAAHALAAAAFGVAALVGGAAPAGAQVDPSFHDVLQVDPATEQWVVRGQIYVPDKADRYRYVEHWVLFPGYVYPSSENGVEMRVAPSSTVKFASEREFFAQPFPKGSRYVKVQASESDTVPTAGGPGLVGGALGAVGGLLPNRSSVAPTTASPLLAGTWGWVLGGAGLGLSALGLRRRSR